MARLGILAACILVLAACSPTSGAKQAAAAGELEISAELETASASPREGDLVTLIFRIRNGSKNAVILRDLSQPRDLMLTGTSGAVMTWQYAQSGLVTYSPERDEWTYDKSKRPDVRRPVFNSGLVVPEESLVVRARVRLLDMPVDFQFSYFELNADELRRKVYFESREDKVIRYKPLVGRDLQNRLVPSDRPDESGHRIIIFPHAEPIASNALLKTFRFQQPLRPRMFSLEQAARKLGVPKPKAGDYTYSVVFDAWVLPKEQGLVLVTPVSVTPMPELRQMERLFYLLDSTVPEKITIELRAHAAASALSELKYPLVKQEKEIPITKEVKEKRVYYYLFLSVDQLTRFFADLRTLKLAVDLEYAEGGGRLLVLNR